MKTSPSPGPTSPGHVDERTGLPCGAALHRVVAQHLAIERPDHSGLAVLVLRLDGVDAIAANWRERVVAAAAERLIGCVRVDDLVMRRGEDEFALLLDPVGSPEVAGSIAAKISRVIARGFVVAGRGISIGSSIGIAVFPRDGLAAERLVERADRALWRASRYGDSFLFDDEELNRVPERAPDLRDDPRSALENGEFFLEYQPLQSLHTDRTSGAEALIRWRHPQRGIVPPDAFIPVVESTGLIHELGLWVLEQACRQAAVWGRRGLDFGTISVNISGRQLACSDLPDHVERVLARTRLSPEHLQLELTESALMHRPREAAECLRAIRAQGVRVALDDFGSGYSSLAYLLEFPLDAIKIDRGFIARVEFQRADRTLVSGIIALARKLCLRVIAEGVETERQLELLRKTACDEVQGFLIGRPADATTLMHRLMARAEATESRSD